MFDYLTTLNATTQLSAELAASGGVWSVNMAGEWWQRLKEQVRANTTINKVHFHNR